ncbi:MAG: hypothetical protein ABJB86_15460 [Bacteroidota bacterium]
MTNPFENSTVQNAKKFTVEYHNESIRIEKGSHYRLTWHDGRWLTIECKDDYSKTQASSDEGVRQIIPSKWTVIETSGGPDWINREQLQVVGELILRKEPEADRD